MARPREKLFQKFALKQRLGSDAKVAGAVRAQRRTAKNRNAVRAVG